MAELVAEDCPKNGKELYALLIDFLTDGNTYGESEAKDICNNMHKTFMDKKLLNIESRDVIIAEKLSRPITISDLVDEGHSGVIKEEDFYDALLAGEKPNGDPNFLIAGDGDRMKYKNKKDAKHMQKMAAEKDALDRKITEFMATKKKVPPPRVMHDKYDNSKADIHLTAITLIAGGKALLEKATLRLARGRKYGLVGRNGIGKTTLINALCRKELDKCP